LQSVPEAAGQLCWVALRAFLTASSETKLREFASKHQDETFCCLCVYFDGFYGEFFLYLNIPDQAKKTAEHIKEGFPDLHGSQTLEEVEAELRWNCGDFLYSFVNDDPEFNRVWQPVATTFNGLVSQLYEDAGKEVSFQFQDAWAETACLVALDL
jgi:hypothetical protein